MSFYRALYITIWDSEMFMEKNYKHINTRSNQFKNQEKIWVALPNHLQSLFHSPGDDQGKGF